MFKRFLPLSTTPTENFFLWGPRQTGKSTLIKALYPDALRINLLDTDELISLSQRPSRLRELCLARQDRFVLIDEIQKVPLLLDEVHSLIEDHGFVFGLCGSSARKLKREHANLLGGRAISYELRGLVFPELRDEFDLTRLLNRGTLPKHYLSANYRKLCQSYVNQYLKEEIAEEGLVRRLPLFSAFLRAASFSDAEIVNFSNIASDCGVSSPTAREYFQILEDTLIGRLLPAFVARPKRKVTHAPKFYFFNVAIANTLARRGEIQHGSELFGKAFENWLFNEISSYLSYKERDLALSYWRLASSDAEVDFVVGDLDAAIEAKASAQVHAKHLKGLRELAKEHPRDKFSKIVVSLEARPRKTDDGILILPVANFLKRLWQEEFF